MGKLRRGIWVAVALLPMVPTPAATSPAMAPAEVDGHFARPAASVPAEPVWGHADGLRVGLWPLGGPRGLLRIYAPYLGHPHGRIVNYIAVEPIARGETARGLSELEWSAMDDRQGLRFWSTDSPDDLAPRDPAFPVRGVVTTDGDVDTLTVYVVIEPYRSGAAVYVRLRFCSDRPHEVALASFSRPSSVPLAACVFTATMGNYARLRILHLQQGAVTATELWPGFSGDGFAPRACFPLEQMLHNPTGAALLVATPDEARPDAAAYVPGTPAWWTYTGELATQYWRHEAPHLEVRGCVNGRSLYWQTRATIPGGIAFENFELIEPFREGSEVWFGVAPGLYERPPPLVPASDGTAPPASLP